MEQEEKKETAPCCEQEEYHEDRVAAVKEDLPADEVLYDLAELFKMFADACAILPGCWI